MMSLLFNFMDELLYLFGSDGIVVKDIKIVEMDLAAFTVTAWCKGEVFKLGKHPQVMNFLQHIRSLIESTPS